MNKITPVAIIDAGVHTLIPLRLLLKSPHNARKAPHSPESIEAKAGSIAAKGILQNLVVEPEVDENGAKTGKYLVTIGEGRRLAQCLRVEREEITDEQLIPCVIDTINDPQEISLDENVTRENMHPADQFEAFRALNEERGMSAEDIAARFGVTVKTVKQRLSLGAASPKLMQAYRDDKLNLGQLMAFCVSEDHGLQESVHGRLTEYQSEPHHIRRLMTQTSVRADDRRARFVGAETYINAGGQIIRDLFTEDGGGYFNDAGLLEVIVLQRLTAIAVGVQGAEGWKWAEGHLDFPYNNGMRRAYPKTRELSEENKEALQATHEALFRLSTEYETFENLPEEVDAQMYQLESEIMRLEGLNSAFDDDDILRGGIIVSLAHDGTAKIERGLIRLEDLAPAPEPETGQMAEGGDGGDFRDDQDADAPVVDDDEEPERPLSESLTRDLTAHRTVALRLTLGEQPELAARALAYALALDIFYGRHADSCLEIRIASADLAGCADDYSQSPDVEALQVRHDVWAAQLPGRQDDLWTYMLAMEPESLGLLIAHCVALTINAVRQPYSRLKALDFADKLAISLALDMTGHWRPTARSYFGRVTKGHIDRAVREAKGDEAAERLNGLKKAEMAEAAEDLLAGTGWLPGLLKTPVIVSGEEAEETSNTLEGQKKTDLPEAAE